MSCSRTASLAFLLITVAHAAELAAGDLRIRDVCRVKGQEENTLHGYGLVVGLQGTGDNSPVTLRSLARTIEYTGLPVAKDATGKIVSDELKDAKNVAMVYVTAVVPAEGAREGDRVDVMVSAVSAKSLQGGTLLLTPLLGPRPGSERIYGIAQGPLTLGASETTTARVSQGCRLEEDLPTPFSKDGKFTLVLKSPMAGFNAASEIEEMINSMPGTGDQFSDPTRSPGFRPTAQDEKIAQAIDTKIIEVHVPEAYANSEIEWISQVLDVRLSRFPLQANVVINERDGIIVVGEEVEIRPCAVTHKNLTIEPSGAPGPGQFIPINPIADSSTAKLSALVNALNALKVPTADQIAIIKQLEVGGYLYGQLIID